MTEPERLTELAFDPVVELTPWAFSPDRPTPAGPSAQRPDDWYRYWLLCLADAGVTGLEPIRPGSMFVPTRSLADPATLGRVVRVWSGEDLPPTPETASALYGGLAASSRGTDLFGPACCGDLKDWAEWRDVAGLTGAGWRIVWIGHPWVSVRPAGGDLLLTEPHEGDAPEPRWVVNRGLVAAAADRAREELEAFAGRLAVALGDVPDAGPVARILAGLDKPPPAGMD